MAPSKSLDKIFYKLGSSNDSDIATAVLAGFKLFFIPFATLSDKKATKEQKEYAAARDFLTELIALTTYVGVTKMFKMHGTTPLCLGYYKKKAKLIKEGKIPGVDKNLFTENDFKALENIDKKSFKSVMHDNFHRSPEKKLATAEEKAYVDKLTAVVEKFQKAFPEPAEMPKNMFTKLKRNVADLFSSKTMMQLPKELYGNTKLNISQVCIWTLAVFIIPPMCNLLLKPVMQKFKQALDSKDKKLVPPEKLDAYPTHHVYSNTVKKNQNEPFKGSFQGRYVSVGNMKVGV